MLKWVVLFLDVLKFFFWPEVKTSIDTQCAEGVRYRKVGFAIVVSVENQGGAYKILSIVIYDGSSCDEIEVNILYPTFIFEIIVVNAGFLVAYTR